MQKINTLFLALVMSVVCIKPVFSHNTGHKKHAPVIELKDQHLKLESPRIRVAQAQQNSAGFVKITNMADTEIRLIKAETEVANVVELHLSSEEEGVHKMRPVEYISIPAQQITELKPGSYHIMLIGLKENLKDGDLLPLTLHFSGYDPVIVSFQIKKCCGSCH